MTAPRKPRARVMGIDLSTGTDFGARVWGYIDRDGIIHVTKTELLPPKAAPGAPGRGEGEG